MAEGSSNGAASSASTTIRYGGHDRFVLELEFVQMLANPRYLNHLATNKYFDNDEFVAYLEYLQYFRQPKYIRYLQ
ncbi:hypothetical protein PRZ48_001314 [Zasmidium cellare]|uniref:Mediator of RNA polymerase II transcription subunit 31 n=1 Tax=Zasmidium cellare TaxID=395010 RepID=A0ABR0F0W6_ZASCE|nr:hypothetical protein PRZ48_001314 [Zasmidium cellare]